MSAKERLVWIWMRLYVWACNLTHRCFVCGRFSPGYGYLEIHTRYCGRDYVTRGRLCETHMGLAVRRKEEILFPLGTTDCRTTLPPT